VCSSIFGSQTISREITRVAERCARKQTKLKIRLSDSAMFWVWKAVLLYGLVKLRWLFQISSLKTNLNEVENWTWQKRSGMWVLDRMVNQVTRMNSKGWRKKFQFGLRKTETRVKVSDWSCFWTIYQKFEWISCEKAQRSVVDRNTLPKKCQGVLLFQYLKRLERGFSKNVLKWQKNIFISWYEATCSCYETTNDWKW
jgi:hypothetical protein